MSCPLKDCRNAKSPGFVSAVLRKKHAKQVRESQYWDNLIFLFQDSYIRLLIFDIENGRDKEKDAINESEEG